MSQVFCLERVRFFWGQSGWVSVSLFLKTDHANASLSHRYVANDQKLLAVKRVSWTRCKIARRVKNLARIRWDAAEDGQRFPRPLKHEVSSWRCLSVSRFIPGARGINSLAARFSSEGGVYWEDLFRILTERSDLSTVHREDGEAGRRSSETRRFRGTWRWRVTCKSTAVEGSAVPCYMIWKCCFLTCRALNRVRSFPKLCLYVQNFIIALTLNQVQGLKDLSDHLNAAFSSVRTVKGSGEAGFLKSLLVCICPIWTELVSHRGVGVFKWIYISVL